MIRYEVLANKLARSSSCRLLRCRSDRGHKMLAAYGSSGSRLARTNGHSSPRFTDLVTINGSNFCARFAPSACHKPLERCDHPKHDPSWASKSREAGLQLGMASVCAVWQQLLRQGELVVQDKTRGPGFWPLQVSESRFRVPHNSCGVLAWLRVGLGVLRPTGTTVGRA